MTPRKYLFTAILLIVLLSLNPLLDFLAPLSFSDRLTLGVNLYQPMETTQSFFEEDSELPIVFIGSSSTNANLYNEWINRSLEEKASPLRSHFLITYYQSFDAQYLLAKKLLEKRRVKVLVINTGAFVVGGELVRRRDSRRVKSNLLDLVNDGEFLKLVTPEERPAYWLSYLLFGLRKLQYHVTGGKHSSTRPNSPSEHLGHFRDIKEEDLSSWKFSAPTQEQLSVATESFRLQTQLQGFVPQAESFLRELISLCQKENTKLILLVGTRRWAGGNYNFLSARDPDLGVDILNVPSRFYIMPGQRPRDLFKDENHLLPKGGFNYTASFIPIFETYLRKEGLL